MKRKTKIYLFLLAPFSVYKVRQMFANRDYNDCRLAGLDCSTAMDNHESNTRQTKVDSLFNEQI